LSDVSFDVGMSVGVGEMLTNQADSRVSRLVNDLSQCEPQLLSVVQDLVFGDEDRFLGYLEGALMHGNVERVRRVGEVVERVLEDREFVKSRQRARGGD